MTSSMVHAFETLGETSHLKVLDEDGMLHNDSPYVEVFSVRVFSVRFVVCSEQKSTTSQ